MLSFTTLSALLLALQATASPVLSERSVEKRHSNCFSYNQAGCQFGTTGRQGAVATVSSYFSAQPNPSIPCNMR